MPGAGLEPAQPCDRGNFKVHHLRPPIRLFELLERYENYYRFDVFNLTRSDFLNEENIKTGAREPGLEPAQPCDREILSPSSASTNSAFRIAREI